MSRSYKLDTLFRHNYKAFTEKTRREGDIYRHQNGKISNSVFEKNHQARLMRHANARFIHNATVSDPDKYPLPVSKKTVLWLTW